MAFAPNNLIFSRIQDDQDNNENLPSKLDPFSQIREKLFQIRLLFYINRFFVNITTIVKGRHKWNLASFKIDYDNENFAKDFKYPPLTLPIPEGKEGVLTVELSPGVIIIHNISAPSTTRSFRLYNYPIQITTFTSPGWKEYFLELPPFRWNLPLGFTPEREELFWRQPENIRHFNDTNVIHRNVVWETEYSEGPAAEEGCSSKSTHHIKICTPSKPFSVENPEHEVAYGFAGAEICSFQHFFDNGLPIFASAQIATGFDENTFVATDGSGPNREGILNRMGYKKIRCGSTYLSAKRLIQNHANAVVHPLYYEWFRRKANFPQYPKSECQNIILLPRGGQYGGRNERNVRNLLDLVPILQRIHGVKNVIVFSKNEYNSLDQLIEVFGKAKIILGPHGGAFYNQFFAPKDIDVIEMIPLQADGRYIGQSTFETRPAFAPLAMYSNTQLLGQRFWRYTTIAWKSDYNIDIKDFIEWGKQVPGFIPSDFELT